MTYHEKLDKLLTALSKNTQHNNLIDIVEYLDFEMEQAEFQILAEHLVEVGVADCIVIDNSYASFFSSYKKYRISLKGLLFLETSSFQSEVNKEKNKKLWIRVKTIAAILNAVLVLAVAAWGVYITQQANDDKKENKILQQRIDSLNHILRH